MRGMLIICALLLGLSSQAQQEWVYSMQALNLYDGNAAAAGMYEHASINLRYRQQFSGFSGSPTTAFLSANTSFGSLNGGLRLKRESIGAFDRTMVALHLAYRLDVGPGQLSFALGGGIRNEQLDVSEITVSTTDVDVLINSEAITKPLLEGAMLYRSKRFFAGIEVGHLLTQERRASGSDTRMESLAMIGTQHRLNSMLSLRPMIAARYDVDGALLPEAQVGLWWKQTLWIGAGYRLSSEAYGFVEYRIKRKLRLAYGFGVPTEGVGSVSNGHHEVMLGFLFGKKQRSVQSIRYFQ